MIARAGQCIMAMNELMLPVRPMLFWISGFMVGYGLDRWLNQ